MASSDSLHLDEHLARLLAAYDQGIDDGDGHAQTIDVPAFLAPADSGERPVEPLSGSQVNKGSLNDLLPDAPRSDPFVLPAVPTPETHRVGRFELRRQLGRGGCGIVFLAHDPKLKRDVALKIPRPELLMNADARRRLVREATAAAGFDHPNLVPVYETGEIGPVCFIATVFCPGQTLSEWLDRQVFPVPIRQAARLVAQLAEAVQHAHDRGVLHRDLKPNNVILQEVKADPNAQEPPPGACPLRGDHYIPRVVDFGLAKLADQGPGETATRQVLGTPKYMAPEQAQARHEDVGPEADVYALGGILYEMITGRAPYEGATDVEVLRQCIEGKLTPPRSLRKEIPRDLEAICIKAMARSPARRYRSAIDFADDLRRFLEGLPTLARPLNGLGRASKWLRRNDQLFALIVVSTIAVVLLASGFWSAYQTQKFQVVQNESQVREAERSRLEYARSYVQHVRDAFHLWQAGNFEPIESSLQNARLAAGSIGNQPEFAWSYIAARTKARAAPIAIPAGKPLSFAMAPGGARFATGHEDGTLTVWDFESMRPIASIHAHGRNLTCIAFVDASKIITLGAGTVRAWLLDAKGEPKSTLLPSPFSSLDPARGFALAPDGKALAIAAEKQPVKLDSVDVPGSEGATALAFVTDSTGWRMAVGMEDGVVRIYDRDRRESRAYFGNGSAIVALAATADGSTLAAACVDRSVCLWDARNGSLRTLRGFDASLRGLGFGPDNRTLLLAADNGLHRIDSASEEEGYSLRGLPSAVTCVATRSDSSELAVAYADGTVELSTQRGSAPKRFAAQNRKPISVLRFPNSGPPLGVELDGSFATLWQFGDTPRVMLRRPVRGTVADLNLSSAWLAVGDDRGHITVWDIENGETVGTIDTKQGAPLQQISFSDNGRWLATPIERQAIGVWFVGESSFAMRVPGHPDPWLVKFVGDGRVLTAGPGSTLKTWDLQSLREEHTMIGHVGRITSVAASPDLRTLATGAANGDVKLWDLRTGRELLGLQRHGGPVLASEFSADGKLLLTGGASPRGRGELIFWDALKD